MLLLAPMRHAKCDSARAHSPIKGVLPAIYPQFYPLPELLHDNLRQMGGILTLHDTEKKSGKATVVLLVGLCLFVIVLVVCAGAAYTGIQKAKDQAASAHVGYIEAVLLLAERQAADQGLGEAPAVYENMLQSYDNGGNIPMTTYERSVLQAMLERMGTHRDFDFAITRYEDGFGIHTVIYYFPTRGRTDMRRDAYYEYNGQALTYHRR